MSWKESYDQLLDKIRKHVSDNGGGIPYSTIIDFAKQAFGTSYDKRYVEWAIRDTCLVKDNAPPSNGHIYMTEDALAAKAERGAKRRK